MAKFPSAFTEKTTLAAGDFIFISDSEASNAKKKVNISRIMNQHTNIPIAWAKDGATPPDATEEYSNTNAKESIRKFSGTANQDVKFAWPAPNNIKVSAGITFRVNGVVSESTAPTAGEKISFTLAGYSVGDGDSSNGSYGTAVASGKTFSGTPAQHNIFNTVVSSTVTITNLAKGEKVYFQLIRDATGSDDTYAQKIAVTDIDIYWVAE